MSRPLAALRRGLDAMPSPVEDRPGLLLRDPFRYTQDVIVVPPPLVPFLRYFDGTHDDGDLAAALHRATGELGAGDFARRLAETLGRGGFLEDDELARRREVCHHAFAEAPRREASHAGEAYPGAPEELGRFLAEGLGARDGEEPEPPGGVFAIAAPHVSFEGGFRSYASAYRALPRDAADRTFVVLGTSHYGAPERFGLTRKPYSTPLGETTPDVAIVDRLAAAGGPRSWRTTATRSSTRSSSRSSFLQHLYGPGVRVVPVLCGPFAKATLRPAAARGRRGRGALPRRARRAARPRRRPDPVGAGRRHGARGPPLRRRPHRPGGRGAPGRGGAARPLAHRRLSPAATHWASGARCRRTRTTSTGAGPHRSTPFCGRRPPGAARCCATSSGTSIPRAS